LEPELTSSPPATRFKWPQSKLDRAFYIGLWAKAIDGCIELIGGLFLLFVKAGQLKAFAQNLAAGLLDQDRDDFIYRAASHYLGHLTGGSLRFAAIYLVGDAVVKLVLIYEVMHKRYWAYLGLIVVLSILVLYQTYRVIIGHSILLTLLTLFDVLIIYLSAKEYGNRRRNRPANPTQQI
jgi:uncharacterized membrane protein